jgi:Tfp pilus assembly protein FimT
MRGLSHPANRLRGFSTVELVVVVAIFLIVVAIAIPNAIRMLQSYRASSSARNIAGQLALTKMRAAADFTQAQLNCNFAGNSCQLQVCTTKAVTSCTTFTDEGGPVLLSQGMTFGFGSITAPAGTQTTIHNTTPILFNSRGISMGNGNDALYLTDGADDTYAVTVYASGRVAVWQYSGGAWRAL